MPKVRTTVQKYFYLDKIRIKLYYFENQGNSVSNALEFIILNLQFFSNCQTCTSLSVNVDSGNHVSI